MEKSTLIPAKRTEAYEKYYKQKYERMCEKQAEGLYEDYLKRVKNQFDQKSRCIDKSQFTNFT